MKFIDKIYYINLKNKTERNEHCLKQFELHNIPNNKIIRFEAIDGNTYNFTENELHMFRNADYIRSLTPHIVQKKIMGNQLSHFNILLEMKEKQYDNIIICQDDVIFRDGINDYINNIIEQMPDNAEIINLGTHKYANLDVFVPYDLNNNKDTSFIKRKITDYISEYNENINPASLCYIVTKKGCENLIDHFNSNGFLYATDWHLNIYLQLKNIFFGSTNILATGNNTFVSDIFVKSIPIDKLINTNQYYTDKNTAHSYFHIYDKLFTPIRNTAKNILEIGIPAFTHKNGGGLLLWKLYFENATIYGVDTLSEYRLYDIVKKERKIITYTETNAYSQDFVTSLMDKNIKFDVIIDDGPHTLETQCKFIELYTPLLNEHGILVIEDVPDIERIDIFKELTPEHLKPYIQVYDVRHIKNRFDDILFVIALP